MDAGDVLDAQLVPPQEAIPSQPAPERLAVLAHLGLLVGHLGDAACVVCQRTKGVHGQVVASMGKHADACQSNRVHHKNELMSNRGRFKTADDQADHDYA